MWENARFAASLVQIVHLQGELKPMWENARFAASLVQIVHLQGELKPKWENARFAASLVQVVHLRGELKRKKQCGKMPGCRQPCTGRSPARRVKTLKPMWENARFAASLVQVVNLYV